MAEPIYLMVVDLSHWDPAENYAKVKAAGIVGVIYKATQGLTYTDPTYKTQRDAAKKAGLKWGSYHFGDNSDNDGQAANYLNFAQPEADELFCLDFEDNSSGSMGLEQARAFLISIEDGLNRKGQSVLYSGNRIKDLLGSKIDPFFGERRLWLAQYADNPSVQKSWTKYWLWQYTDGASGPTPHTVPGCDAGGVDCNSYRSSASQLAAEWATGTAVAPPGPPPIPPSALVTLTIDAPPSVQVKVIEQPSSPS